jgi:phage terminase large subunit-like protein
MLDTVSGALVSEDMIELTRVKELPGGVEYLRYIGLDPSTSEQKRDECGIVAVYITKLAPVSIRQAYIVEDRSDQYTPDQWADTAVKLALKHRATIIAEVNQGGAMIKNSLKQVAKDMGVTCPPIRETWSSAAKAIRAEPVGVAYARWRIHMVGTHELLEDELTTWTAEDRYSPNRLDAMVFGVVAGLFDQALKQGAPGSATVRTVTNRRLDLPRQVAAARPRSQIRIAANANRVF